MNEYSVMEYLYRDADNFKAFGQILITGKNIDIDIDKIKSFLDSGEYFVAEQVGIPTLYSQLWKYSNGPTIADHAFHELIDFRAATDKEVFSLEVWEDIATLLSTLRNVGQDWDCRQSVHCSRFMPC